MKEKLKEVPMLEAEIEKKNEVVESLEEDIDSLKE